MESPTSGIRSNRFILDSGILANLDTAQLTNESFDLTVAAPPQPLKAGDSVPSPADRSEVPHFKIHFEPRKVLGAVPVGANNLDKIELSNTHFKYIRHLDWAGYTVAPRSGDSILTTGGGPNCCGMNSLLLYSIRDYLRSFAAPFRFSHSEIAIRQSQILWW